MPFEKDTGSSNFGCLRLLFGPFLQLYLVPFLFQLGKNGPKISPKNGVYRIATLSIEIFTLTAQAVDAVVLPVGPSAAAAAVLDERLLADPARGKTQFEQLESKI